MNKQTTDLLEETLASRGFNLTKPRLAVFDQLYSSEPQSMRELFSQLQGQLDRASLYRIIHAFEEIGVVQRVYIGWKYKLELTDMFMSHHHHISCPECGKITAISSVDSIEEFIKKIAQDQGFRSISHQLEIQAYCTDCLKKIDG